ncbi:MAG: hypothetical protein AB1486_29570 [Planctomycetota bacterium]
MTRARMATVSASVSRLAERVEHWRRSRTKLWPMPEDLWEAAARLAERHGVYAVARALRLNSASLKQRVEWSAAGRSRREAEHPVFGEPGGPRPAGHEGCLIELEGPAGRRLTV